MRPEDALGDAARLKQHKAEQNCVAHNAPNRPNGISAGDDPLDEHRIDGNAYQNEHPLKAHGEQGTQIILARSEGGDAGYGVLHDRPRVAIGMGAKLVSK